jgi:hypothetical protein
MDLKLFISLKHYNYNVEKIVWDFCAISNFQIFKIQNKLLYIYIFSV